MSGINRRGVLGAGVAGAAALGLMGEAPSGGTLSPGQTRTDFAAAVKAMRAVVGDEWVESVRP